VTRIPVPQVPWQVTGNHWIALPCVHPADGSLHAVGAISRTARAAIEVAGSADFLAGQGPPLIRPVVRINGEVRELARHGLVWERAHDWLPTFTCTLESVVVRGTIFAPYGRDADIAGAIYALAVENRGPAEIRVTLSAEGTLGHRQVRVRTPRAAIDAHRVARDGDVVLLEGTALPGFFAIALAADGPARIEVGEAGGTGFALHRDLQVEPGGRTTAAFYIAAGPERDGARATAGAMRRRGWSELLTLTREALQAMEQTVGHEGLDRLINRNLLFAHFFGVARALDDAHFYLVRSRAPWHGHGVTARDWELLAWIFPAVLLADPPLARELLLRACELHGYAPGAGVNYLDGTLFEAGFSLEGACAYAVAVDRYVRETEDDHIVEEPAVADALYNSHDDLGARRDEHVHLYSTEITLDGHPAPHAFTLHGNAVASMALEVLRRTLDEETAKGVADPEAVRAAILRHFTVQRDGKTVFASAIDLSGRADTENGGRSSALWLPLYEVVERHDSTYRRTVRGGGHSEQLVEQCARLIGPDAGEVLAWLRRAPLDNGLAAERVDAEGRAVENGGDAALAGLLAWSVWYAVHALGVRV
jgi:hypothetical protein